MLKSNGIVTVTKRTTLMVCGRGTSIKVPNFELTLSFEFDDKEVAALKRVGNQTIEKKFEKYKFSNNVATVKTIGIQSKFARFIMSLSNINYVTLGKIADELEDKLKEIIAL